jgi:hypothetical protein
MSFRDLTGKQFGRLNIVSRSKNKGKHVQWHCKCECGGTKIATTTNIVRGLTQSCGCLHKEAISKINSTHGMTKSRTFIIWQGMLARCGNPQNPSYKNYGGRGVFVCDRWKLSFENFLADMGEAKDDQSIDRISVNGIYEPNNCRWATLKEQALNKRNTLFVLFNGVTAPLKTHCENLSLSYKSVHARIQRGWSVSDALSTPIKQTNAA